MKRFVTLLNLYYCPPTTLSFTTGDGRSRRKRLAMLLPWHAHGRLPTPSGDLRHVRVAVFS
jgi:hypothetical protein